MRKSNKKLGMNRQTKKAASIMKININKNKRRIKWAVTSMSKSDRRLVSAKVSGD
jgi:hypothetical protein